MRTRTLRPLAAITLACACSTAPPPLPVAPPSVASPPPVAPAADAGSPAAEPVPVFSIAAPLAPTAAVILAETPGVRVTMRPESGPALSLADGERVTYVEESTSVGAGDSLATVEARGVRGTVPNARVITEERLHRAPSGGAAVFAAVFFCGDLCHGEVWLLDAAGRRTRITDNAGPEVVVAWRPDGARVAVGSYGLFVVRPDDARAEPIPDFTAPAYAPDGTLFVRGETERDDGVFELLEGAAPRRVFAAPGRPPRRQPEVPTGDPSPVTFEEGGAVLRASFWRGARLVTTRFRRSPARR